MNAESIIKEWFAKNSKRLTEMSDQIWEYAEVAYEEFKSSELLMSEFSKEGFTVEKGVAGIPTAFTATWTNGNGPTIGYIGEYDAMPGLGHKVSTNKEPLEDGQPGHGCGHNLLGVGSMGACISAKHAMEILNIEGTLKYFGCPAEEGGAAKVFMVRDGVFDGVDAILRWHPANTNWVSMAKSLAINSAKFTFHGISAHAGINPHLGRSGLDAAILMDVGANYLREHVIDEVRIHSVITNGGDAPNIVPPEGEIWYYVRAPRRKDVDEVYNRLVKIAEGAAMMTGTSLDIKLLNGCHETLPNSVLSEVMYDSFIKMGPPNFDSDDLKFAAELTKDISIDIKEKSLKPFKIDPVVAEQDLHCEIAPTKDDNSIMPISTDSADVSWQAPMAQMFTCCQPIGTANHSWQQVVCSGSGIGHKGMLAASRTIALTTIEVLSNKDILGKAKREFDQTIQRYPYKSPLPRNMKPPIKERS